jgi:2'-5' RNA ligase
MGQVRAFIAIELPDEIKGELGRIQSKLKTPGQDYVRWVDPNGIHLTLKFLGDTPQDKITDITAAMTSSVQGVQPFNLSIKGLGVFPNPNRTQVAWVGLVGELDTLSKLQKQLEANLEKLGFAAEKRLFSPHLTLARLRNQALPLERQAFGKLISETGFTSDKVLKVSAISLMKSQLTRRGASYSRLSSAAFK